MSSFFIPESLPVDALRVVCMPPWRLQVPLKACLVFSINLQGILCRNEYYLRFRHTVLSPSIGHPLYEYSSNVLCER